MGWLARSALMMSPVGGIVKALFAWLSHRSFWQLVCIALACLAVVQHFALLDARHDADNYRRQRDAEHAGRLADRAAYTKAQNDAAVQNRVQVERIETHYQRNSDDERQGYLSDLAKLRADRLRKATPTTQGVAGPTGSPPSQPDTPRIDEAGVCVPAASDVCEAGAEIELRLMHLQNLVEKQSAVDPNK